MQKYRGARMKCSGPHADVCSSSGPRPGYFRVYLSLRVTHGKWGKAANIGLNRRAGRRRYGISGPCPFISGPVKEKQ